MQQISDILSSYCAERSNLIPILHEVQSRLGYLPPEAIQAAADHLGMSATSVYGVATFYAAFKLKPIGRHTVKACRGTACHVKGSEKILAEIEKTLGIKDGETSEDGEYSLETVACLGSCALAPAVVVDDRVYGRVTPARVKSILRGER
jgi:NADH-quinone oxidoreductase E subunit